MRESRAGSLPKGVANTSTEKHHGFITEQIQQHVRRKPQDVLILDAGCGLGGVSRHFAELGYKVIAIDVHEPSIV